MSGDDERPARIAFEGSDGTRFVIRMALEDLAAALLGRGDAPCVLEPRRPRRAGPRPRDGS